MTSKRLTLLRHAKSSWADPEVVDHDRPLNKRGRRDASLVGSYLRSAGARVDLVLCSSATRTQETLELLLLDSTIDTRIEDALYGATTETLLARLRRVSDGVMSVLLVGHNPGIETLTRVLVGSEIDEQEKFPTAGVADIRLRIATWSELNPGVGELLSFVIPRDLD